MNYNHLTIEERACICKFKEMNMKIRKMAKLLDRSLSTISRELKRNSYKTSINYSVTRYSAVVAQKKYKERRKDCHRKIEINNEIRKYIEDKLSINWSPEQIVNREIDRPKNFPCISTIYRWIHEKYIENITMKELRRHGNFKSPAETRGRFNIEKTIKKRPREVYKRNEFDHWEADTVVSGRIGGKAKSSYCFVTLAERKIKIIYSQTYSK